MAINIKRWLFPFAVSGDKVTVPETVSPSGAVSYPQGWGPDYERNPTTDPLAKRIPREESNQLMYDVTASLKALQEQGLSWFIAAAQNGGVAFPYIKGARVLYDAAGVVSVYESLVDSNTALPTVTANWSRVDPARFATQAESNAGALGTVMVAPRELSRSVQSGGWSYAAAAGSANALTATLSPAPSALVAGMTARLLVTASNTAAATLNVNGLGAKSIVRADGTASRAADLQAGQVVELVYDGTSWQISGLLTSKQTPQNVFVTRTPGAATWTVPAGITQITVEVIGGGGGSGGASQGNCGSGGGGGGYAKRLITGLIPGTVINYTVGAGGAAGGVNGGAGQPGGTSAFGVYLSATGGSGGPGNSTEGGAGGTGTSGDINIPGQPGNGGSIISSSAIMGGGGGGAANGAPGTQFGITSAAGAFHGGAGLVPGGGARGGASASGSAADVTGAVGGVGQIAIYW